MVHFEKFLYWQKNSMCSTAIWKQWIHHIKKKKEKSFKEKTDLFNSFFANQYSTNSQLLPTLSYKTNERLSSVKITDDDILKIIAKLDPNKKHGHDQIRIHMIKICSSSICKPLWLIFNNCIDNGIYQCKRKKANVVPIPKKGDKQTFAVKFLKHSYVTR